MLSKDLLAKVEFLQEVENLKLIQRHNKTLDPSRFENAAEHSWHVALMAIVLRDFAKADVDLFKVVTMLLIHDLVEIDAGDTWLYADNQESKAIDELKCAQRLFSLLPQEQAKAFMALWQEFEAHETKEAQFAAALDSLQPLLNHLLTGHPDDEKIDVEKVRAKKAHIQSYAPQLWPLTEKVIAESMTVGLYE